MGGITDLTPTIAASTDIERAFSYGGLTVSKHRHSLSDESVRAATVLGSWAATTPSSIPEEAILTSFREKSKCSKKTKTPNVIIDGDSD